MFCSAPVLAKVFGALSEVFYYADVYLHEGGMRVAAWGGAAGKVIGFVTIPGKCNQEWQGRVSVDVMSAVLVACGDVDVCITGRYGELRGETRSCSPFEFRVHAHPDTDAIGYPAGVGPPITVNADMLSMLVGASEEGSPLTFRVSAGNWLQINPYQLKIKLASDFDFAEVTLSESDITVFDLAETVDLWIVSGSSLLMSYKFDGCTFNYYIKQ